MVHMCWASAKKRGCFSPLTVRVSQGSHAVWAVSDSELCSWGWAFWPFRLHLPSAGTVGLPRHFWLKVNHLYLCTLGKYVATSPTFWLILPTLINYPMFLSALFMQCSACRFYSFWHSDIFPSNFFLVWDQYLEISVLFYLEITKNGFLFLWVPCVFNLLIWTFKFQQLFNLEFIVRLRVVKSWVLIFVVVVLFLI